MNKVVAVGLLSAMLLGCTSMMGLRSVQGAVGRWAYQDELFGISVHIPKGWTVVSKNETERLRRQTLDRMAGADMELRREMEADREKIVLFAHPEARSGGPAIAISTSNQVGVHGPNTAEDLFERDKSLWRRSKTKLEFVEGRRSRVRVGDVDFLRVRGVLVEESRKTRETILMGRVGSRGISIVITYGDDKEEALVERILASVRIDEGRNGR